MKEVRIDEELFTNILAQKLGSLFSKTIEALEIEELKKITPVAAWDPELCPDEEREQARAIVRRRIAETKKQVLYDEAPLLCDVEKKVLQNHRAMVQEVTERIHAHCDEISRALLNGKPFSEVTQISGDGADVHNHGRLTLTVTTPEGKFLYKPHSCKTDISLSRLIESYFSDVVRVPRALDFGDYGFCEFIRNRPAEGREEATAYYHNLGGLSALIHAMGGTDFYCENLLADGRYPVPVDLETIITPSVRHFCDKGKLPGFLFDYNRSIAQSGILPKSIGNIQLSPLLCTSSKNAGAPVVDGMVQTVRGYEAAFFAGFDAIYDRCMALKAQIASAVVGLRDAPIRKLIRNTDSYGKVITHLNRPDAARSPEEQQKAFASLSRYFENNSLNHLTGIPQAEKASLSERDIPYFYTLGKSVDLYSDKVVAAKDFFETSAVDNSLERLNRLSPAEKRFEKSIISRALEYAIIHKTSSGSLPDLRNAAPMTREEALELSGRLLEKIHEASFLSPSGKRGFLGHVGDGDSLSCMQAQFANGVGGICAFGFAAAALDGRRRVLAEDFAEIFQDYLDHYVRFFTGADKIPPRCNDLGLTSGVAGMITTVSCAERFMPEMPLRNTAKDICSLLDIMPVEQCGASDVYSGLSGLILSLYRVRETVDVRRHVCRAADRLLELKTLKCGDLMLWSTFPKTPRAISGFGHGCGGIGLALLCAWEMTGDERYRSVAEDAYAFEHTVYSERIATWPDLRRSPISDSTQYGICSGAPGIALCMKSAQKAGLPYADTDMARAKAALLRQPILPRDTLCCGNCSAAEALITLGLRDEAAALLGKVREKAQINGGHAFTPPNMAPFFAPNLFYGAAGLGYTLLRFAEPDRIPSLFVE